MSDFLEALLRAALLLTSFTGLCAAIRVRLKLDRFSTPFAACCSIIVVLMVSGMLGALKYGLCALYLLGFGIIAAIAVHRNDLKQALIAGVPGMIAVVYVKNSGMFFALAAALCLAATAYRRRKRRSDAWIAGGTCIAGGACIAGFVLAYLLWILHIRLCYADALSTKHAISLSAYAAQAASKGMHTILQILKSFLQEALSVTTARLYVLAFMAAATVLLLANSRGGVRQRLRALAACVGVYLLWRLMMCFMCIFSMPEREASVVASFYRYSSTGQAYMMGLTCILLLSQFGAQDLARPRLLAWLRAASCALFAGIVLVYALPGHPLMRRTAERDTEYTPIRQKLIAAHRQYDLPDGGNYLVFCHEADLEVGPYNQFYHVKYEFETANIRMIAENEGQYLAGISWDLERFDEPTGYLSRNLEGRDALLVLDACPDFEAALSAYLEAHPCDTPIIYVYNLI